MNSEVLQRDFGYRIEDMVSCLARRMGRDQTRRWTWDDGSREVQTIEISRTLGKQDG